MSDEKLPDHLKIIVKATILTIVILVSYGIGFQISAWLSLPHNDVSGMWCAVTAIVVFDDLPDNAKALMKDRLLGTLVGAVITTVSIVLTHHPILSICISLFTVSVFVIFFNLNGALKIACVTVVVIGVTSYGYKYSNNEIWMFASMRFFESVIGGMVSLLATIVTYRINNRLHLY